MTDGNLTKIFKEEKEVSPTGTVIKVKCVEVQYNDINKAKEIFDQVWKQ